MAQPTNPDVDQQGLLSAYKPAAANGTWSTGLFECYAEPGGCGVCLLSACLPCVQYGLTVEKLGPQLDSASDCLTACCCSPCGLCQEAREVEIRSSSDATKGGAVDTSAAPPQTQTMTQTLL